MAKDDGGPAFPSTKETIGFTGGSVEWHVGMSLRDYFAGQALIMSSVILSARQQAGEKIDPALLIQGCTEAAYLIADAMLDERAK